MTGPMLTVILPVHNGLPYLQTALQSVLDQMFSEFHLIVIDDGSSDGSREYLASVCDPRVTVIHQECAGLGAVLNRGIDLCATPFLARMDADDFSEPERFKEQLALLQSDPSLVAVGSPLTFLVHNRLQQGIPYPTEHDAIVADLLRDGSSLSHPTLMLRTSAAKATRYRIRGAGEDLDFCLRLCEHGRVTNLPRPRYRYRLHERSLSMTRLDDLESGYAYARLTASERSGKLPETTLANFTQQWKRRTFSVRARTRLVTISLVRYRKARLAWAQEKYVRSTMHLAISVALQPVRSVKLLGRNLHQRFAIQLPLNTRQKASCDREAN